MLKRLLDISLASLAIAAGAPLMAALAVAVKLDSDGPVLFVQTRVGCGRRPIRIAKFRTMTANAETQGPAVTASKDPRITRVGAFLRKTKLDELPQLWNVLRGDMSLVGPRPEVPAYVERYRPEWQKLLTVRPGLTDIASLTFRHEEDLLAIARDRERAYMEVIMPMKLELALQGIERSGITEDLRVLARTTAALFTSSHAQPPAAIEEARRRIANLNAAFEGT